MNEDFLRTELRDALDGHRPDRTVMLNRIAANRAEQPRPRGRVWRLAGAALAVTTVLGLGGVARWALADEETPPPVPAAPAIVSPPPAPTPSSSAPRADPAGTAAPPARATTTPTPSTAPTKKPTPSADRTRGLPGDTQVDKGTLKSASEREARTSTVTLKPGADLTELDLVIRVVRTGSLGAAGTEAPDGVTGTVEEQGGLLLYRFTLRKGATLPAGTYQFTARHTGTTGNASQDTYEAYAFSVERKLIHVYGNFAPD
jgi:hypothetical protein